MKWWGYKLAFFQIIIDLMGNACDFNIFYKDLFVVIRQFTNEYIWNYWTENSQAILLSKVLILSIDLHDLSYTMVLQSVKDFYF